MNLCECILTKIFDFDFVLSGQYSKPICTIYSFICNTKKAHNIIKLYLMYVKILSFGSVGKKCIISNFLTSYRYNNKI